MQASNQTNSTWDSHLNPSLQNISGLTPSYIPNVVEASIVDNCPKFGLWIFSNCINMNPPPQAPHYNQFESLRSQSTFKSDTASVWSARAKRPLFRRDDSCPEHNNPIAEHCIQEVICNDEQILNESSSSYPYSNATKDYEIYLQPIRGEQRLISCEQIHMNKPPSQTEHNTHRSKPLVLRREEEDENNFLLEANPRNRKVKSHPIFCCCAPSIVSTVDENVVETIAVMDETRNYKALEKDTDRSSFSLSARQSSFIQNTPRNFDISSRTASSGEQHCSPFIRTDTRMLQGHEQFSNNAPSQSDFFSEYSLYQNNNAIKENEEKRSVCLEICCSGRNKKAAADESSQFFDSPRALEQKNSLYDSYPAQSSPIESDTLEKQSIQHIISILGKLVKAKSASLYTRSHRSRRSKERKYQKNIMKLLVTLDSLQSEFRQRFHYYPDCIKNTTKKVIAFLRLSCDGLSHCNQLLCNTSYQSNGSNSDFGTPLPLYERSLNSSPVKQYQEKLKTKIFQAESWQGSALEIKNNMKLRISELQEHTFIGSLNSTTSFATDTHTEHPLPLIRHLNLHQKIEKVPNLISVPDHTYVINSYLDKSAMYNLHSDFQKDPCLCGQIQRKDDIRSKSLHRVYI